MTNALTCSDARTWCNPRNGDVNASTALAGLTLVDGNWTHNTNFDVYANISHAFNFGVVPALSLLLCIYIDYKVDDAKFLCLTMMNTVLWQLGGSIVLVVGITELSKDVARRQRPCFFWAGGRRRGCQARV